MPTWRSGWAGEIDGPWPSTSTSCSVLSVGRSGLFRWVTKYNFAIGWTKFTVWRRRRRRSPIPEDVGGCARSNFNGCPCRYIHWVWVSLADRTTTTPPTTTEHRMKSIFHLNNFCPPKLRVAIAFPIAGWLAGGPISWEEWWHVMGDRGTFNFSGCSNWDGKCVCIVIGVKVNGYSKGAWDAAERSIILFITLVAAHGGMHQKWVSVMVGFKENKRKYYRFIQTDKYNGTCKVSNLRGITLHEKVTWLFRTKWADSGTRLNEPFSCSINVVSPRALTHS